MAGYRDTLNLPKTEFAMKADLPRREPERLAWWNERQPYRALRERRLGARVWLLHDGPPYSNGHLHMGTAANKIWKDAAVRVASLMGLDAPFVPGWDNHGMPIEVQVGKEMRHAGDLGNLTADNDGKAHYEITVSNISVAGMKNPIIGRGVIVHAKVDDGSQPVGNAGGRIACGVIGVANPGGEKK